ncbi:MAG TPA: DUF5683 domain-containing protein [Ignavibacteriaceae bacterium]|nr:DUF5683 domain-containing protein [Ignavibacteriaceae bacterium]
MQSHFRFIILIFVLAISQNIFSQSFAENSLNLSGSLHYDSKILLNNYREFQSNSSADELPGQKSPVLSGVFSAIIPGAGQVYNEDWWIAGVFLAAEVVLITTAITYENKGDEQTESFEMFADENWSVVDYAEWLAQYEGADITKIVISNDESLPPWERVDWDELNAAETGSHNLPPHGEQQYYEVIGKYHQYSSGWNDFTGGSNKELISPNFTYYAGERGTANDYYSTSSTVVVGIYINHLLSAAEAVLGANRFNNNLSVSLRVQNSNLVDRDELVPTLFLRYNF